MRRRLSFASLVTALLLGVSAAGARQSNLITNGDFSNGFAAWSYFDSPAGSGEWQVSDGVFEWNLPGDATTQSVVYQVTGVAVRSTPLGAQFDLGNSSKVRKGVTVLMLDADFSDFAFCRFTLDPGVPMRTYRMRTPTKKPWANAAIYFYATTSGNTAETGGHLQLDNVSLQRAPGSIVTARECLEPGDPRLGGDAVIEEMAPPSGAPLSAFRDLAQFARLNFDEVASGEWVFGRDGTGARLLRWKRPVEVDASTGSTLTFVSSVEGGAGAAEVQASIDGVNWRTVARIPPEEAWTEVQVDLSSFAGHRLFVQFAYTPLLGESAVWRVTNVRVTRRD
jgi:hypothetical protein